MCTSRSAPASTVQQDNQKPPVYITNPFLDGQFDRQNAVGRNSLRIDRGSARRNYGTQGGGGFMPTEQGPPRLDGGGGVPPPTTTPGLGIGGGFGPIRRAGFSNLTIN